MEIIDNVNKTLKEDMTTEIHKGSKVFIAVACFSIYELAELKKQLKNADELRFYAVSRDSSMGNDSVATNFDKIFASISPETVRKVL